MFVITGQAQAYKHHRHHRLVHAPRATTGTTCNGEIDGQIIRGNLTVPPYGECQIEDSEVTGNTYVGEGAFFLAGGDWFQRNLTTTGAFTVNLIYSEVDGNSSFDGTSGFFSACDFDVSVCEYENFNPGTVSYKPHGPYNKFGNVSITNTNPAAAIYGGNFVAGNLSCYGNAYITNDGYPNTVLGKETGQCAGMDSAP